MRPSSRSGLERKIAKIFEDHFNHPSLQLLVKSKGDKRIMAVLQQ